MFDNGEHELVAVGASRTPALLWHEEGAGDVGGERSRAHTARLDAIRTAAGTDVGGLSDAEIMAELAALRRQRGALDAREAFLLAELDRRRDRCRDGAVDIAASLRQACGVGAAEARRRVEVARGLRLLPEAAAALQRGEIDFGHVTALSQLDGDLATALVADEAGLVDRARCEDVDQFRRSVRLWAQSHRSADDADAEALRQYRARRLGLWDGDDGMVHLQGRLTAAEGQIVRGELGRLAEEMWRNGNAADEMWRNGDAADEPAGSPSPQQRMADALVEMARRAQGADVAAGRRVKPTVIVTIPLDVLEGRLRTERAELVGNGSLSPGTARRLACEARLVPAVLGSKSEPLDLGRSRRLPNTAQRLGLVLRDGGCAFPGCDRRHEWCEVHHIRAWDRERGPTDLDLLVLLCAAHHHLCHEGGWRLERHTEGTVEAWAPDGRRFDPARMRC